MNPRNVLQMQLFYVPIPVNRSNGSVLKNPEISGALYTFSNIGSQDQNRRYKLILKVGLSKGFAPTRLIISIFHCLIG